MFCKIEKPGHGEELVLPNRPRVIPKQQASQPLSLSSQFENGLNLSTFPPRLESLGVLLSDSRARVAEWHRSVSQDQVVFVETFTPRSSYHTVG